MDYGAMTDELFEKLMNIPHMPKKNHIEGMNRGMPLILNYLLCHDGVQPIELSDELSISTARVAVALNNLERKGLVIRKRDPDDRRKTIVCVTQAGIEMGKRLRVHVKGRITEVLEDLGEEDASEFVRIAGRIIESLRNKLGEYTAPGK